MEELCFICLTSQSKTTESTKTQQTELEKQVEVVFLLTKLMEIPSDVCKDFLNGYGNPSDWISYCEKCSLLIKKHRKAYDKLLCLQNTFNLLKTKLKSCIQEAHGHDRSKLTQDRCLDTSDVKNVSEYILNLYFKNKEKDNRISANGILRTWKDDDETENSLLDCCCIKEEDDGHLSSGIEDNNMDQYDYDIDPTTSTPQTILTDLKDLSFKEDFQDEDDLPFKCEYCPQGFKHKSTQQRHTRRFHTKEPTHACENCGEWFPDRKDVLVHFSKAHPNDTPKKRKRTIRKNHPDVNTTTSVPKIKSAGGCDLNVDLNFEDDLPEDNLTFKCEYCSQVFKHKSSQQIHIRRFHTQEPTHACEKCGEWFPDRKDVLIHFSKVHPDDTPNKRKRRTHKNHYEVDSIILISSTKSTEGCDLKLDLNVEDEVPKDNLPLKCEYCPEIFKHKSTKQTHTRRFHTKEPTHACEKCGEWFPDRKDVLLHFSKEHPNDIPNKRKRRIRKDHNDIDIDSTNPITLTELTDGCNLKDVNVEGEIPKDNLTFKCDYCSQVFKHKSTKRIHTRRFHTKELTHACEKCGEWFSDRRDVLRHFSLAHPGDTPNKKKNRRMIKPKEMLKSFRRIICETCGVSCRGDGVYKNHLRIHTGDKQYLCELCSQRFSAITFLTWHKHYSHYKELNLEPFQCKECGKFLRNPPSLKYHMAAHHGKKDVLCNICGAGFVDKYKLADHMEIRHDEKKNFECKECGEKLFRKRQIDEHRQKHSGIYDHICQICQKGFATKSYLRRHMKYHSSDFPRKRKSRLRNPNGTDCQTVINTVF